MTKLEKLLKRIRANPKNVSLKDIQTLLNAYGFELRRVKGSHHIFGGTIGGKNARLVIPFRQPFIKEAYVKEALELVDKVEKSEG